MGRGREAGSLGLEEPGVSFHESILTSAQMQVLRRLAPIATKSAFYLAGGTAIALWFGHRRSEDFDWFASGFGRPEELLAELRSREFSAEGVQIDAGTLTSRIGGVKVSFFDYQYPLLDPVTLWPDYGIGIASSRDLGAMKLAAIAQRGSRKDFVDVHELLRQGRTLAAMLDDYRSKFRADTFSALMGLTYFDDAEAEPMPEMLGDVDWHRMKAEVSRAVREVVS